MIQITNDYLINENFINKCDTYNENFNDDKIKEISLENYLLELVKFIYDYLIRFPEFYPSIKKKKVCFEIFNTSKRIYRTLDIQNKLILSDDKCHKKFIIPSSLFNALYDKKIVFENLYTGYESEIMRYPNDVYNRDIILYLNMFGYKFKNK